MRDGRDSGARHMAQTALDRLAAVRAETAPAEHTHSFADVPGLQTALDGRALVVHPHTISDVGGLQAALDGKQPAGSYAAAAHGHSIADVAGLQAALDGKAATGHTHAYLPLSGGALTGDLSVAGGVVSGGSMAFHGRTPPTSGVGLELEWFAGIAPGYAGAAIIRAYDRTNSAHQPLIIEGATITLSTTPTVNGTAVTLVGHGHSIADVTGLQTALDAKANASSIPALASGTYTPTLFNVSNVDASTAYACQYMRVGNTVTVSGRVDIDPTATGIVDLAISLPIASSFTTVEQAGGTAGCSAVAQPLAIYAGAGVVHLVGVVTSAGAASYFFSFTYRVI